MRRKILIKSVLGVLAFSCAYGTQFTPLNVKGYESSVVLTSDKAIAGLDLSVDNLISAGGTDLYAHELDNIMTNSVIDDTPSDENVADNKADKDANKKDDKDTDKKNNKDTDKKDNEETTQDSEEVIIEEEKKSEYANVGISIANDYVNVRAKSNTDSEIVGKLYRGCAATLLKEGKQWVKIESGNVKGYIKKEYLAIGFDAEELVDTYGTKLATVNTMTLNVRTQRNTNCKILTQIPVGETYEVIKEYKKWVEIAIDDDLTGYVAKEYVDIEVEFQKAISIEEEQEELRRAEEARKAQEEQERLLREQQEREAEAARQAALEQQRREEEAKKQQQAANNQSVSKPTSKPTVKPQTNSGSTSVQAPSTSGGTTGQKVADYAQKFVGNRYVYGGTSLTNGTDCSGFTQSVYKSFGISIPRDSRSQSVYGTKVGMGELKAGDLIFYTSSSGRVNHVAMYIGDGKVCHASNSRDGIKISSYNYRTPYCARRIIK